MITKCGSDKLWYLTILAKGELRTILEQALVTGKSKGL